MSEGKPRSRGQRNYRADGDALRYFRDKAHLTLKELEEAAGVSYTTISRIETGEIVSPRWGTLRPLANALGVNVDDLVIYNDPSSALTLENRDKIAEATREKEQRDTSSREEKDSHDSRDRAS